MKIYQAKLF